MDLILEPDRFAVCRLAPTAPVPWPDPRPAIYSVTVTPDELSIVCAEGHEPTGATVERGWRVLRIEGPLAFELVGVLASITVPLAGADIGVFVLSTFDTDLVLVKDVDLDAAIDVLGGAGHRVRPVSA